MKALKTVLLVVFVVLFVYPVNFFYVLFKYPYITRYLKYLNFKQFFSSLLYNTRYEGLVCILITFIEKHNL